jgi:hypothetical protein
MIAATVLSFPAAMLAARRTVWATDRHRGEAEGIRDRGGEEIDRAAVIEPGNARTDAAFSTAALSGIATVTGAAALRG